MTNPDVPTTREEKRGEARELIEKAYDQVKTLYSEKHVPDVSDFDEFVGLFFPDIGIVLDEITNMETPVVLGLDRGMLRVVDFAEDMAPGTRGKSLHEAKKGFRHVKLPEDVFGCPFTIVNQRPISFNEFGELVKSFGPVNKAPAITRTERRPRGVDVDEYLSIEECRAVTRIRDLRVGCDDRGEIVSDSYIYRIGLRKDFPSNENVGIRTVFDFELVDSRYIKRLDTDTSVGSDVDVDEIIRDTVESAVVVGNAIKRSETTFEKLDPPGFGLTRFNVRKETGKDLEFSFRMQCFDIQTRAVRNGIPEGPVMTLLRRQYDAITRDSQRMICGEVKTWDEVLDAIPNMELFLAEIKTFIIPQVFYIDSERLFVGEGASKPDDLTRGEPFFEAEELIAYNVYLDVNGEIVKGVYATPSSEDKLLLTRGLFTKEEYSLAFTGTLNLTYLDGNVDTWLAKNHCDEHPWYEVLVARFCNDNCVHRYAYTNTNKKSSSVGARPVARFELNY